MKKNTPKGLLFLVTAAVIWGAAFVAQRVGADKITPFFFNASRFIVGAVSLIPLIFIFERGATDRKMMKTTAVTGVIAGLILFTASYLQQLGVGLTDSAGKSGFITGLYMIIVPIIGIFIGKKTAVNTWIGAILGVGGLFLICMSGTKLTFTPGDLVLIGCAVMFAVHILVIDHFGDRMYSLRFSMIQFATAGVVSLIFAFIFEPVGLKPIRDAIIPILYCGIFSTGVGYTCQTLGQKFSEPTSASIILSTESVFSAVFGAIILSERMLPTAYVGCVLIFAGIIITQLDFKKIIRKKGA